MSGSYAPGISVVVPCYRSSQTLPDLIAALLATLASVVADYEVILVNDGSPDNTWEVIEGLAGRYTDVRGICLMRNYGQHNALLCGIRAAKFPVVVTMDDDLQHPPAEIPMLLAKLEEGYDVVYGVPHELPHSLWRNLLSKYSKWAMANAMGIRDARHISAFRALRTDLRQAFEEYQSPSLLLDVLLSWGTTRFGAVHVNHMPRKVGTSNYNFMKLSNQFMLMLTGFSTAPLRFASLVGLSFTLLGVLVSIYVAFIYLFIGTLKGFAFLASLIAIFSGAQLFALGIFGEYLARMFNRSLDRPTYVIRQTSDQYEKQLECR